MAYRQGSSLAKLIVLAAVVWAAWRYGVPWVKEQGFLAGGSRRVETTPNTSCVLAADDAVAAWSRGVVRFMNPPIDSRSWTGFRREVESAIDRARSACGCPSESCKLAEEVMRDLERLVSDMDRAARSGGAPPGDLVRMQESIDLKIEEAWKLADAGK